MGGGEGGNFVSGGEVPGIIFKSVIPDRLCRPDNITPAVLAVCQEYNPQFWDSLCATGGSIES